MRNEESRRTVVFLAVAFIFLCLGAVRVSAQQDTTTEVAIAYSTGYPGKFAEIAVLLKNPDVEIAGMEFLISAQNPELINFHTDSIEIDTIAIPVDTCTWEPPPEHPDTCFVDSLVPVPVRFCYIDTAGSLINDFEIVECHGDTGDTSLPRCKWVKIVAMGQYVGDDIFIDRSNNWRTLFRLGVDMLCIPDSTEDRSERFLMYPQATSWLSDRMGETTPFHYEFPGELFTLEGREGDANGDSLVTAGDIVYLISYLYRYGPRPCVPEAGDANGDCLITAADVVYLLTYLYRNGPPPKEGCWHGK